MRRRSSPARHRRSQLQTPALPADPADPAADNAGHERPIAVAERDEAMQIELRPPLAS